MNFSPQKLDISIIETNFLDMPKVIKSKSSSDIDLHPNNWQFFSFHDDDLEIKCCIGVFLNTKVEKYSAEIFLKKFKLKGRKMILSDQNIFLKCCFSGFGEYYCAISSSYLTCFPIHRSFSSKNDKNFEAIFEVIPLLPFKLEKNEQLFPFLAISHSPIIPSLKYYDTEWPFVSYIRQILTTNDGTIAYPPLNISQNSFSIEYDNTHTVNNDFKNDFLINQILGVTQNICNELGERCQTFYGVPKPVYKKNVLKPDTDFIIYALPAGFQLDLPTIISDDFADINPFHLCSLIRKEIDSEYYYLTVYFPSFDKFYTITEDNISSIDSKPGCYSDEYIISSLYIRLNVLNIFRFYSPSPGFTPRFNLVDVYEVTKVLYISDFKGRVDLKTEFLPPHTERADDLDNEPGVALFPYDPKNNIFPSIPLTCASSKSILKLPIDPKIKKFQLIWYNYTDSKTNSDTFLPVIVDLTNSSCIKYPGNYDLLHISSNYLTVPYKSDEALPTGPMVMFKIIREEIKKLTKASSVSFGKRVASDSLIQFTQPPIYDYIGKYDLSDFLENAKRRRGINKCNCYIRSYIKAKKITWEKIPEGKEAIDKFYENKYDFYKDHNFVQFFVELQ